jgi:hypothetical protein
MNVCDGCEAKRKGMTDTQKNDFRIHNIFLCEGCQSLDAKREVINDGK